MLTLVTVLRQRPLVVVVGQMSFVLDDRRLRVILHLFKDVPHVTYAEAMKTKRRHIDKWRDVNRARINARQRLVRPSRAKP